MIEYLGGFLPIIIYILLIILLVILINITLKLNKTLNKLDMIVDNIDKKVNSLNGLFGIIDMVTDKVSIFSDKVIDGLTGMISRIFKRKKNIEEEENE